MTIADFCRAIHIKPTGGNYRRVYDLINKYDIIDADFKEKNN